MTDPKPDFAIFGFKVPEGVSLMVATKLEHTSFKVTTVSPEPDFAEYTAISFAAGVEESDQIIAPTFAQAMHRLNSHMGEVALPGLGVQLARAQDRIDTLEAALDAIIVEVEATR